MAGAKFVHVSTYLKQKSEVRLCNGVGWHLKRNGEKTTEICLIESIRLVPFCVEETIQISLKIYIGAAKLIYSILLNYDHVEPEKKCHSCIELCDEIYFLHLPLLTNIVNSMHVSLSL
jgi:hypothetical protein